MKAIQKALLITTVGLITVPFVSSAITVRTIHHSSSGGVSASEGTATVTGDESSSVSVENIMTGTRGTVQITTEKDGVTTTETHDINGGGSVIVTPTPPPEQDSGARTPREPRGSVAVAVTSSASGNASAKSESVVIVKSDQKSSASVTSVVSTGSGKASSVVKSKSSILALAGTSHASVRSGGNLPMPVIHVSGEASMSYSISQFFSRVFSIFGM